MIMAAEKDFLVILPVDFSPNAEFAFDWYVNHIHRPSNHLILIHIPECVTVATSGHTRLNEGTRQQMLKKEKEETEQMLAKYTQKLKDAQIQGEYKTYYATNAGEAIVEAAEDLGASVVVMGTRGMGKIRRTIIGSVSDYVIHHAHVPVMICRQ